VSEVVTQTPKRFVRLVAVAGCAVLPIAGAACVRKPTAATAAATPTPEQRLPVTLRVTNNNWSDMRIYVVRGSVSLRLGLVTTNSTAEFLIPPDFLNTAASATLIADPVGGQGGYSTSLTGVMPGDELELTVATPLQYSHLVVR
jgi:hypothetical protein